MAIEGTRLRNGDVQAQRSKTSSANHADSQAQDTESGRPPTAGSGVERGKSAGMQAPTAQLTGAQAANLPNRRP